MERGQEGNTQRTGYSAAIHKWSTAQGGREALCCSTSSCFFSQHSGEGIKVSKLQWRDLIQMLEFPGIIILFSHQPKITSGDIFATCPHTHVYTVINTFRFLGGRVNVRYPLFASVHQQHVKDRREVTFYNVYKLSLNRWVGLQSLWFLAMKFICQYC